MPKKTILSAFFFLFFLSSASGQSPDENISNLRPVPFAKINSTNSNLIGVNDPSRPVIWKTNTIFMPSTVYVTQRIEVPGTRDKGLPDKPSLWKAFIPGWGQFERGEKGKGLVLAGFFAASVVCSIAFYADSYNLKDKSIRMVQNAEQVMDFMTRHVAMSNAQNFWDQGLREEGAGTALVCVSMAVWAYSVFDTLYTFKRTKALEISFWDDRLMFRYRIRI